METKDIIQLISLSVASVGGLIAAFKAIDEMKRNREQRQRELLWKQALTWKDLISEIRSDGFSKDAMMMLEWGNREYELKSGRKEMIAQSIVWDALITTNHTFSETEVYIRECFDHFFESLYPVERYLGIELINFSDVEIYLSYQINTLSRHRQIIESYLDMYDYHVAKKFLERFVSWKQAQQDMIKV